jgi:hypothetical protein
MAIVSRRTRYCVLLSAGPFFTSTKVNWFEINIIVQVDNNGVFKSVYVVHYEAVAVVRAHGCAQLISAILSTITLMD